MLDVKTLREKLAAQVAAATGINWCDPWWKGKPSGSLPGAFLEQRPSPIAESPQRLRVDHSFDIVVLVATRAQMDVFMSAATPLIDNIVDRLHANGGSALAADPGAILSVKGYHIIEEGESPFNLAQTYALVTVMVSLTEVAGQSYGT